MASITKRPDGKYRARYRDPSGRELAKHFDRKVDAQRWIDQATASIITGQYVDPRAGRVTFGSYASAWLAQQPHRPGTARLYERTLRLHVLPTLGAREIGAVRRSDVQALVVCLGQRLAPKTVENTYRLIKSIFAAAVDDQVLPISPCRKVTRQRVEQRHVVPLPLDKVRAAADLISPRLRALVLLSVGSGLRQGEALGLTVDRIDFLRREVTVDRQLASVPASPVGLGPLKTPASRRVVPLPSFVVDALAQHLAVYPAAPDGLVFTGSQGQHVARAWLHRAWRTAISAAELPESTTWHLLRHTYASILIDGGESVTVVARRLGHANPSETLRTYSHLWPDSDERTRAVVDAAFQDHADSVRTGEAAHFADLRRRAE